MLFGVPDEIPDIMRAIEMVQKRRLIYRIVAFGFGKISGITSKVPGVTNGFWGFTGRGHPPGRGPNRPMGGAPALSGLVRPVQ